jgi:DNA-damage-inducible protein D
MKARIQDEGFHQLSTQCRRLKLRAADGKSYATDCADAETLLRIVQSIPSPKAEPVKRWLATVGTERLEEMEDPSRTIDRARQYYLEQGYGEDWISARLRSIIVREDVTEEWRQRGAREGKEFGLLTDTLHQGTFDISTDEHKNIKRLEQQRNLRDSMTAVELALATLAEATATELHRRHQSRGLGALRDDARQAGDVAGNARRQIESLTGAPVVSDENYQALTSPGQPGQIAGPAPEEEE